MSGKWQMGKWQMARKWQMGRLQMAGKWQMGKLQMANGASRGRRPCAGAAGSDLPSADLPFAVSRRRRGFSLIEMLVALAITSALLSASLAALDTSFKSYQMTSQSSSTHVVTRIVMHRMLSMIRVGTEFGPFPEDVLTNPLLELSGPYDPSNPEGGGFQIEFVNREDPITGNRQITRLEARKADPDDGTLVLWLVIKDVDGASGTAETVEQPMLRGVREAAIALEYDVGPKLRKASIDLTVISNDLGDEIDLGLTAPVIRLVASASPRNLE